jgi:hypothetical protein
MIIFLLGSVAISQNTQDSSKISIAKKALTKGINLISRDPSDSVGNEESSERFEEFTGKIIRNIYVENAGFESSIYGSQREIIRKFGLFVNKLHHNTREKTIRQHLFIKSGDPLNPYEIGDNERYLRQLDFILESRIVATSIEGTNFVDLTIVTRDVFSIGADLGGSIPSAPRFSVFDANLDGGGQQLRVDLLIDGDRTPKVGYGVSFRKSSLWGSLANLELAYSQLNTGLGMGEETEYAYYMLLERPLVSPYSRLAGGLELSQNWSQNVYSKPDSAFLDYKYNVFDFWMGYNFGVKKDIQNRMREFLAVRFYDGSFIDSPDQEEYNRPNLYRSQSGVLAEYTIYKKNYFKTRYVYGFGRTEDQPYGYSFAVTAGYIEWASKKRPYLAAKANYSKVNESGSFYEGNFNLGSFFESGNAEDIVIQSDINYFTPALSLNRFKLRGESYFSYTAVFNQKLNDFLDINSNYVSGLRVNYLQANRRYSTKIGGSLYTPWSIFGFRLAPFADFELAGLLCNTCVAKNLTYYGISSGIRTRNENLIFGTMEIKFTYVPKDEIGDPKFRIKFRQNLRISDKKVFVKAPGMIRYN